MHSQKTALLPRAYACADHRTATELAGDDAHMALALITVWAIHTGRSLPQAPMSELTAEELEDFWADEQMLINDTSGRPDPTIARKDD